MIFNRRKTSYIKKILSEYGLDVPVCIGIYNIETYYRKFLFRACENIYFVLNFILNKLFKIPIKNLTIGEFQIGLTSILRCNGYEIWQYYDYLSSINFRHFCIIIKAMFFKNNVEIFCKKVSAYGIHCGNSSELISKYAELYNGDSNYILMLNREYNKLKIPT